MVTVARQDFGRNHMRLKDCSCTYSVVRAHDALGIPRPHRVLERWKVGPCEVGLRKQIGVQCEDIRSHCLSVCLNSKYSYISVHIFATLNTIYHSSLSYPPYETILGFASAGVASAHSCMRAIPPPRPSRGAAQTSPRGHPGQERRRDVGTRFEVGTGTLD